MGNSQTNKTLIAWIDPKVNSPENKKYQNELESHKQIELECFTSVEEGIKLLKRKKFQNTIIITSGRIFPKFYEEFSKCTDQICLIPKIIIFTGNAEKYISDNRNSLPLKDPFYNNGGVIDKLSDLKKFIESSMNQNNPGFEGNNDEKFQFEDIADKNDLILPIFYPDYLKTCPENEIQKFNEKILSENKEVTKIESIFSQLTASGNIPINLLTKFWVRAYSAHASFSKNMNGNLVLGGYKEYSPFILKLYESVEKCVFNIDHSTLYKGIIVDERAWKPLFDKFKSNNNNLPAAILYGASFFSFYKDERIVEKSKEKRKGEISRFETFIWLILEGIGNYRYIKNQACINKEVSYSESDDEVLFFPFSCFEIKKVEKKGDKEYVITLNYLVEYQKSFNAEESRTFKDVTENDYSKMVLNSGLINSGLIGMPSWFKQDTIIIPNDNYQY